jgi:hypothetical protein
MRARAGAESTESRGATARNDWFYPVDGASGGDGSITAPQDFGVGVGGSGGGGEDAVSQAPGPASVEEISDCPGGVCPVPWAVKQERPIIQPEQINHPPHYNDGGIECIEAIEAALTNEEFRGYCKGNLMKYAWRERMKGGVESLKKAQWYLDRLIQLDESQNG